MKLGGVAKKAGIALGVLFVLLVLTAVIVPLVVNVDDYRPQIEKLANDHLTGRLHLGKLSLSLWGQVRVQVDGISVVDASDRKVVSAKEVFFHLPFTSLLSGAPQVTLQMKNPELFVEKEKNGKMNVLSLVKTSPEQAASSATPSSPPPSNEKNELPGMVLRAKLGLEIRDALLSYKDDATGLITRLNNLNVVLKDVSLTHPTELEAWANLDTKMGRSLVVKGPAKIKATASPQFEGAQFKQANVKLLADLNDLEILMPGLFEKKKGVVAGAEGELTLSPTTLEIPRVVVKFLNAELKVTGKVADLGTERGPDVGIRFQSNEIALKPWNELIPMLKAYDLGGSTTLGGNASGPLAHLQYAADIAMKRITAKAPQLKSEPQIDGQIKIITDQVQSLSLTLKAPGNDLRVSGKVVSFSKPRIDMQLASSGLDLDALMNFPKSETAKGSKAGSPGSAGKESASTDYDAMLAPVRDNELLRNTAANLKFNLAFVKAKGMKCDNMAGVVSLSDLTLALESFRMGIFGGTIGMNGRLAIAPRMPTYSFGANVSGLDIQQAVAHQFEKFKNTLLGKLTFKIQGSGASLNPDAMMNRLNANGSLRVDKPLFQTLDIGRMATEAINKAARDLAAKIPALANQSLKTPASIQSHYQFISSDFSINGGRFSAPNFNAKAEPNSGIDVKGDTNVGLTDYALKANWQLIDTYNLTHARDLSVQMNAVRVDHILAEGAQPVVIPVQVGGTLFSPAPNYSAVPEVLGKIALGNTARAAGDAAKAAVRKQAEQQTQQLLKKAPPAIQDAAKEWSKKLFGN